MTSIRQNPAMVESSDSEFEDDIAQVTGKKTLKKKSSDTLESDENSDQSFGDEDELSADEEEDILADEEVSDMEDNEEEEDEMGSMEGDFSEDELEEPKLKDSSSKKRVQFQDEVQSEKLSSIKKRKVDPVVESAKDVDEENGESFGEESVEDLGDLEGGDEKVTKKGELWEDIYGRTRDKSGNVVEVNSLNYYYDSIANN
jgi:nucleolar MIF4G domain-containing protein 1